MNPPTVAPLQTANLEVVPNRREDTEAMIAAMTPDERAQLSADWLARLHASSGMDPWVHGFTAVHRASRAVVGMGAYKGPPRSGAVEIAYGVAEDHRGKGYATEIAAALTGWAFTHGEVDLVLAHTYPDGHASQRVLAKCGFVYTGEVMDPDDGRVRRFEKHRTPG